MFLNQNVLLKLNLILTKTSKLIIFKHSIIQCILKEVTVSKKTNKAKDLESNIA